MKIYSKKMEKRIVELLNKLPYKIEHKILDSWFDSNSEIIHGWTKDNKTLFLDISKDSNNQFTILYLHEGFEGEKNRLPLKDSEVEEFMEYGCIFQEPEAKPLDIALEDIYNWLLSENLISE